MLNGLERCRYAKWYFIVGSIRFVFIYAGNAAQTASQNNNFRRNSLLCQTMACWTLNFPDKLSQFGGADIFLLLARVHTLNGNGSAPKVQLWLVFQYAEYCLNDFCYGIYLIFGGQWIQYFMLHQLIVAVSTAARPFARRLCIRMAAWCRDLLVCHFRSVRRRTYWSWWSYHNWAATVDATASTFTCKRKENR